ncbi:nucleobindin-2 isoform X2 [Homalodisca vitripennis]|uniref:nucleobindin-2 isoform X2 n=1 Tax=Homalodisca vitripennis TaxID=197043 RepID=UPI001EEB6066|nr:nucleobindin-2 isoform X2 [Homalodisca vitripennis]
MRYMILVLLLVVLLETIVAPPVTEKKKKDAGKEDKNDRFEEMGIEYNRYLVQVVEALESDPEFRKKLENATSEDIQSGKIADELDFVSHNVRTKLDELKRVELERLRKLARQAYEQENDINALHLKMAEPEHLDHANPHTFEIADLKKLIAKTAEDLAEADKQRREEFKAYEMEKEFEQKQKLAKMDEEKKNKYLEELEEQKKKHKKHDPIHHPGSKQQLEEVWEKQDHMEDQQFDPKAFFFMHDLDGNGVWDEAEVKSLFLKELDKLYEAGAPEDDMRERAEEMERMREHVFREADLNRDNLISFDEFLQQTKKPEFERDEGWETLDEQQIYTQDEYKEFERQRQEEIQRLIREGKLQPPPVYHPPPPPGYHPPPQGFNPGPVQGNQIPPYHQQAQAYQQQQVYQQQQHFQQQQHNTLQQQQQYQQQNPQHYQQQQYQQPQQYQQAQHGNQQPQYQQPQQVNQQYQQPLSENQQPQQVNQQPQPKGQQYVQQNIPPVQQQPLSNNIPQQPMTNNIPQQPVVQNIPQQPMVQNIPQQPVAQNIPKQPVVNIPQQPVLNSVPQQQQPAKQESNIPVLSNEIPKAPPLPVQSNSIPQGPK